MAPSERSLSVAETGHGITKDRHFTDVRFALPVDDEALSWAASKVQEPLHV